MQHKQQVGQIEEMYLPHHEEHIRVGLLLVVLRLHQRLKGAEELLLGLRPLRECQ